MGKFTTATAKSLAKPGMYRADPTLYLAIAPGGSKSWIQRITIDGKRRDLGLGPFPVISLAKARERAFANRVAIADGRDPLAEKRKARVPMFQEAAKRTYEANRPRWRSEKVAKKWWQAMEKHAFPILGDMRVDRIGREDVLRVLTPLWTSRPEQARKVRQSIRSTLSWAQAHGLVEVNVAGDAINGALPAQPAVKEHLRALPYRQVARGARNRRRVRLVPVGETGFPLHGANGRAVGARSAAQRGTKSTSRRCDMDGSRQTA